MYAGARGLVDGLRAGELDGLAEVADAGGEGEPWGLPEGWCMCAETVSTMSCPWAG